MQRIEVTQYNPRKQHMAIIGVCPHCRVTTKYLPLGGIDDLVIRPNYTIGHRACPQCGCYIHFQWSPEELITFPAQGVEFDASGIPPHIASSLEEAIRCYSHKCNRAAAMLIRRTMEEICKHQGADGNTLWNRIDKLKTIISMPERLFDGMHELRLLGNDAAHVESTNYNSVGNNEIEASIAVIDAILDYIYKHDISGQLVEKLKALRSNNA